MQKLCDAQRGHTCCKDSLQWSHGGNFQQEKLQANDRIWILFLSHVLLFVSALITHLARDLLVVGNDGSDQRLSRWQKVRWYMRYKPNCTLGSKRVNWRGTQIGNTSAWRGRTSIETNQCTVYRGDGDHHKHHAIQYSKRQMHHRCNFLAIAKHVVVYRILFPYRSGICGIEGSLTLGKKSNGHKDPPWCPSV